MSGNIRRLATLFSLAICALIVYLTYWQVVVADELRSKMPFNAPRLQAAEARVTRGTIRDRNGQRLAWTEQTAQGPVRRYASPTLAHVVGYYSFRFGTANVEREFDDFLAAERGLNPLDLLRKEFLYQPVVGADVTLTIDSGLQRVADEALGARTGAVIALDPRTGEILALASHPYFDANRLEDDWERVSADPGHPLINRATTGQYVPGSTFKTVTLAAAWEAGIATAETTFTNKGDLVVDGFRIKYTNPPNKPTFDLRDAFAFSVNAAFAELGLKLGRERLVEAAARFGIGSAPPLAGLPVATSNLSATPEFLNTRPALASTAFGQGQLAVTPLQMALVAAAVANGGAVPTPYVVADVRDAAGRLLQRTAAQPWRQAMSPATAKAVSEMMVHSVEVGFAEPAHIAGIKVGGKTGTAETSEGEQPHAWFIGYAPADDPQIAVAVVVEHGGEGSRQAAPAARQVMQAWLSRR